MHIQSDAEEIPGASHTQSKGGRWLCVHTVPEGVEFCHILLHVFFLFRNYINVKNWGLQGIKLSTLYKNSFCIS